MTLICTSYAVREGHTVAYSPRTSWQRWEDDCPVLLHLWWHLFDILQWTMIERCFVKSLRRDAL